MSDAAMIAGGASEPSQASETVSPMAPTLGLFRQFADRARGVTPLLTPVLPSRFESALPSARNENELGFGEAMANSPEAREGMLRGEDAETRLRPQPRPPQQFQQDLTTRFVRPSLKPEEIAGEAHGEGSNEKPYAFHSTPGLSARFAAQSSEAMLPKWNIRQSSETASETDAKVISPSEGSSTWSGERLAGPSLGKTAAPALAKPEATPWGLRPLASDRNSQGTPTSADTPEQKQIENHVSQALKPASFSAHPAAAPWAQTRMSPETAPKPGNNNKSTALAGTSPDTTMAQRLGLTPPARQGGDGPSSGSQGNIQVTPAATAPQVHIRIGRVDFRGVPSAAPARPAPAKPAGPAMDLEGYLRSLDRRTR